jgi:hypothetical protein
MSGAAEWEEFLASVPSGLERPPAWLRSLGKCEAILGLTATFFLGYGPAVTLVLTSVFSLLSGNVLVFLMAVVPAAVTTTSAVWVTRAAKRAVGRCYPELGEFGPACELAPSAEATCQPFGVAMGVQSPRPSVFLRPVLGAWWFSHFAAGVLLTVALHRWIASGLDGPQAAPYIVIPLVLHFAFNIGANLYLLLSIGALCADEWLLKKLWRARLLIDIGVTLATVAVLH